MDGKTGALLKDKAANVLDNIEAASRNASKQIFCSFWAGPYTGFKAGWPAYYDDSQPSGAPPTNPFHWPAVEICPAMGPTLRV